MFPPPLFTSFFFRIMVRLVVELLNRKVRKLARLHHLNGWNKGNYFCISKTDINIYGWKLNLKLYCWKGYLPNVLVITLLPRLFVYWARYFKFWLLAYFFILLNCAKFEEDWTTFILDILWGSPLWIFGKLKKQKTSKGDPCKMSNINVVQSCWNFAKLNEIFKK